MVNGKKQRKFGRGILATGGGILFLFATVTLLYAALRNWTFTTANNYTFDSTKIEVSSGLAKLKVVSFIHDEEADFSGAQSNTQWATDHIELDATGLSTGSGTYTSQIIDSGTAGTAWGGISWSEALSQDSASFSPTKSVGSLSTGMSVYGADIDGDDDIDVVAVQGGKPRSLYFENDGAETFTSQTIDRNRPSNSEDLHVADINKDGRPDLVVIASGDLDWFENRGGTPPRWRRRAITPSPSSGFEVEVADINGDGNLDVVIGDDGNVQWYENDGANPPSWTSHAVDGTLSVVDALSTGDLDGDGDLDLLAGDEGGLYWYENSGASPPLFTKRNIDTTIVNAESIIAADFNNDGKMDVAGVGLNNLGLSWYENNGLTPPGFTKRTIDSGPLISPVSVAAGDLDRDSNVDLVLVEGTDVHWYHNDGGAQPTWVKTTLTTGTVNNGDHLFLVNLEDDVNGDDDLDIIVAEGSQASWWENLLPHSNVRFQLRTSTDGISWSSWQGPGGRTTSSYTNLAGEVITVPNGRYIQYRAFLRTHNSTILNSQLSTVRLDPANTSYPTDNPTVQNVTGQDYASISSFTETLGGGNQGVVKYQISSDGTNWYYHNSSLWVSAVQGFDHANSAAEVSASISTFADDVGPGTFYFKAFLNSDGNQQVELDQIEIDYSTDGLPTQLAFSVEPSNAISTEAIAPAIKVQVLDANGNLVSTASTSITLAIGTNPGGGTLSGGLTVAAVGGEATFNDISIDEIGSGYTLVASVPGLTSANSATFDITAGATQLAFSVQPTNAEVTAAISPAIKVQVLDANGNLVTTATESITLAIGNNPGGAVLGGSMTVAAVGGEAVFNDISIDKIGSGYTLTAASGVLTSATSAAFNITAGAASQLAFSVEPTNAISAEAISPAIKVQVRDANGNLVTTATGPITLAIGANPGGAVLGGNLTVAAVGGEAVFNDISIDKIGIGYTLDASISGLSSATSAAFNITAGAASQLAFSVEPTNAISAEAISPAIKVQVRDANGNLVTTATGSITLSMGANPGGATLGGNLTVAVVGGEAVFNDISIDKIGIGYTLDASISGLSSATSAAFNITAGAASKLVFSVQPTNGISTEAISPAIKVQVHDANGNLVPTATEFITLSIGANPGGAALGGSLTVAVVGGEATFNDISIDKVGSGYTLTAAAGVLTSATSAAFNITAGAASQLAFSVQPSNAISAGVISPAIKVQVRDTNGNLVTTATESITLAIGANPGGAALGGSGTVAAVGGEAVFNDISIDKIGIGYTLVASISGLSSATSAAFNITTGAATQLVFSVEPTNAISAEAISPAIKVQVRDANGNLVTTATDSITLAIGANPGGAALGGNLTVAAVGGEAVFNDISIDKVGSGYTLTAASGVLGSATSAAFNITAGAASKLAFSVEPTHTEATATISPAIKVQMHDANGNLVTTATGSITLAIGANPSGAALGGTLTVAAVGGEAVFNDISIDKVGSGYTLTAASGVLTSAASVAFDITAGDASRLVFSVEPTNTEATATISPAIKVQVHDANGNLVTTATGSITLAIGNNPGGAALGGSLTVAVVGGEAVFNDIWIDKVGNGYTLTAASGVPGSATSAAFNITAGAASKLAFSVQPSNAISAETIVPAIKVQVHDANGNLVTTATESITLAIGNNPGGATLGGSLTVAAVAGEATFSGISINKAGSGYTLVASVPGLISATSAPFNITAGAASKLVFSVEPTDAVSAQAISPAIKVQVHDANGNLVATATESITLAIGNNPGGATLGGSLTVAPAGGEAVFNDISIDKIGIGYTLAAASGVLGSATSAPFNITAGAASKLAFSVEPTHAEATAPISPAIKVQVHDANGNLVATATESITLAIGNNPGGATLGGSLTVAAVGGEAVFNDISIDKIGIGYTLTAVSGVLSSATSAPFNIMAGAASKLVFSVEPTDAVSAGVISPAIKVQVHDANGNLVTTATESITLAIGNNPGGAALGGSLTVATVGGEAVFNDISIDKIGIGYTLTAVSGVLSSATSAPFNITAGAASKLAFSVEPTNTEATATISPAIKVQVHDANGNLVTTATESITLAIGNNPGGAALGGSLTVATVEGEAVFNDISIDKVGSGYTLVASVPGSTAAISAPFHITAGAASKLVFSVEPTNAISAAAISPAIKVQVHDANGNLVTTATESITLAIGNNPGGAALGGSLTVAAVGGEAVFNDISIDKVGSGYTLVASVPGLTSATSAPFNITAGAATQLLFSVEPTDAISAEAISPAIKVQVHDANGNLATTATTPITLAIGTNPGGGTLSGSLTVAAVGGEVTFSGISIDKAGSGYTLVASVAGFTPITSAPFNITAGAATQLVFSVEPTDAIATEAISPVVKVQVHDANGNLATTATTPITLAIGANPGGATLGGTLTVAAVGGEAVFNDISIDKIGIGYTLTAASGVLGSATSAPFNITAGLASKLVFSVEPTDAIATEAISPVVKVQVHDANGSLVTTATTPITLAIGTNPAGGTLSGALTVAAVGGEVTFSGLSIDQVGSGYILVASVPGLSTATSAPFNITAGLASKLVFSVEPTDAIATEVISPAIKVQVHDANGNQVITATDSITLAIGTNPAGGTLSGSMTVAAVGGEVTFSGLSIDQVGSGYTLVASVPGLGSVTSAPFNITAGAASKLVFSVEPTDAIATEAISPAIKVQVHDANGNQVITATDSITLAIGTNPAGGTLSGSTTVAALGGEVTFSGLSIDQVGSGYTLVASVPGLSSATSAPFNITAGAASKLVFSVEPTDAVSTEVISPAIKVQVHDANGKLVTTATTPITLAIGTNPAGGTLSGALTVAAVGGEVTFSGLSIDQVGSGYILVASVPGLASATSASFNITAGLASKLVFSVEPSDAIATEAISPALKLQVHDANGNLVTTATDSITLAIGTNPGFGNLSGALTVAAVGGEVTFSGLSIDQVGSGYTLVASVPGLSSASSAPFNITAGLASKLVFSVEPTDAIATEAISPAIKVQVHDANGKLVTTATDSITLTLGTSPTGGALSGTSIVAAVGGEVTFSGISIDRAGSGYTLVASAPGLASATSAPFNITTGLASKLVFSVEPSDAIATKTISPAIKVQVHDANGNQVITATDSITLAIGTNPAGGTLSGVLTVLAVGGEVTFSGLSIDQVGSGYTLVASVPGLGSATSAPFNITAGLASKLVFSVEPTDAIATKAISPAIKVQVHDANGKLVTTATDSITLAMGTNPGFGNLSGALTVAAVGGEVTFSGLSIDQVGSGYTLVASVPGLSSASSVPFNITARPASKLVFSVEPTDALVTEAISPAIKVQVHDANGKLVTTATDSITLTLGTSPTGGALSGTSIVAAVGGEVTFSGISIDRGGSGYTLVASAPGLASATSAPFNITTGLTSKLVFSVEPLSAIPGEAILPDIKVQVQDINGKLVTSATDSITLAIGTNPVGGTLSGALLIAAVGGEATFSSISIDQPGSGYTFVASAPGLASATSAPFNVVAGLVAKTVDAIRFQDTAGLQATADTQEQETPVTIPNKVVAPQTTGTARSNTRRAPAAPSPDLQDASTTIPQQAAVSRDDYRAALLNRETVVKEGTTVGIQYRTASGLTPMVDVYDSNYVRQVAEATMTEIGTTGIYEYQLTLNSDWGFGDYTIIASESSKGTLDSLTLKVAETGIPTIVASTGQINADTGTTVTGKPAAPQTNLDTVNTNLNNPILSADSINFAVEQTNGDLVVADSVVDDIQAKWGTLTAQQVLDSITSNIAPVLGTSSDTATAATVFGRLADLNSGLADQPASVPAGMEVTNERGFERAGEAANGVHGLSNRAISAASAANIIIENVRIELDARGKTDLAHELIRQLRTTLTIIRETVTAIPERINPEPMNANVREVSDLLPAEGPGDLKETTEDRSQPQ